MSAYVIDASVAAKWIVEEEHSATAHGLLGRGDELHVPEFFFLETDNVICKLFRRGAVGEQERDLARSFLATVSARRHSTESLRNAAYSVAIQTGCAMYDCLYLSLAIQIGAPVITADRRFFERLAKGPFAQHVVWLGDIA